MKMKFPRPSSKPASEPTESEHFAALMEHQRSVLFPPVQVLGEIEDSDEEIEQSEVNLESLTS